MKNDMKSAPGIGMIGVGAWGKNILRNLAGMGVVRVVCDLNPDVLEMVKQDFPDLAVTTVAEVVFHDPEIDAVVIATPAESHAALAKQAILAGKDVFVEKPLALTVSEGEELVHLASGLGRILMVGHVLQYHPAICRLKQMIDRNELGNLQYIYSNRLNLGKLRVEENILWSFAPHDISVLLMLLGQEPERVSCFGGSYVNREVADITLTTLEFGNGVKGHIFVSWLHPFKEQKLVVVGDKAMAVFDDMTGQKLFLYPHRIAWNDGGFPVAEKADFIPVSFQNAEPLREELEHFISCVTTRQTPRTNGEEALRVLRVLERAEASRNEAGIPVEIL